MPHGNCRNTLKIGGLVMYLQKLILINVCKGTKLCVDMAAEILNRNLLWLDIPHKCVLCWMFAM